jgi:hypothetical protein
MNLRRGQVVRLIEGPGREAALAVSRSRDLRRCSTCSTNIVPGELYAHPTRGPQRAYCSRCVEERP